MGVDHFADVFNGHIPEKEDQTRLDVVYVWVYPCYDVAVGLENWRNVFNGRPSKDKGCDQ